MKKTIVGAILIGMVFACSKDDDPVTSDPVVYDCAELSANVGDPCDDGDESTLGDVVTTDCLCVGETLGSPVVFDLEEVPYPNLSDYHFFEGDMAAQVPVTGVLPFDVISHLFTDYALKKRFIWMPDSVSASYTDDHDVLDFPNGTVLLKTFYYDRMLPGDQTVIIETRMEFKRNDAWEFANYVWNEDQTEAVFDLSGETRPIEWLDPQGNLMSAEYRIPAEAECLTCHKFQDEAIPVGPKPQNLFMDLDFADGTMNQMAKWVEEGYLEPGYPANISAVIDYDDDSFPIDLRLRSYLDINCAHCHRDGSHCDYRPIRLSFEETIDPTNLGVCVVPDDPTVGENQTHIIRPQLPEKSMMYYRMETTNPSEMMPLIGRSIVHEEGLELLLEYINSLEDPC